MSKRVLIVEDERAIVEILKFNLMREGYETLEALEGPAGLELARTADPDLILLDVMLPGMNGFEICSALRDDGSAVPIIMLTAREEESDKVFGLEAGADDFEADGDVFTIYTQPDDFNDVAANLGKYTFVSAQIEMVPQNYQKLETEEHVSLMEKLLDIMEDDDDVQNVWHNWEQE